MLLRSVTSSDLASSDFSLFNKITTTPMEAELSNEQQLLDGVLGAAKAISRDELGSIFEECLLQLDECIQTAGDFVE
jgi:hypothetical protein